MPVCEKHCDCITNISPNRNRAHLADRTRSLLMGIAPKREDIRTLCPVELCRIIKEGDEM